MDVDVEVQDTHTFILTETNILKALRLSKHKYKISNVFYNNTDKIFIKVSRVDDKRNCSVKLVESKTLDEFWSD